MLNDGSWFFLSRNQLFLFFQDTADIVTKQRNRLLSSTADLHTRNDKINTSYIEQLIDNNNHTKLDHGLPKSDINLKHRQNYNPRIKLISVNITNLLNGGMVTNGTVVYLALLKKDDSKKHILINKKVFMNVGPFLKFKTEKIKFIKS